MGLIACSRYVEYCFFVSMCECLASSLVSEAGAIWYDLRFRRQLLGAWRNGSSVNLRSSANVLKVWACAMGWESLAVLNGIARVANVMQSEKT